jgi:hypothetical protein
MVEYIAVAYEMYLQQVHQTALLRAHLREMAF